MREKHFLLKHLNARAAKALVFGALCRIPPLRSWLNYYEDAVSFEDVAEPGSLRSIVINPAQDYGLSFSERELHELLHMTVEEIEAVRLTYNMVRLSDVTILGSSGVTVDNRTGKVLGPAGFSGRLHPNWVAARPLKTVYGDGSATHVNLLWMRKGHRHFFHFFWDLLLPLLVYFKNWHDPDEKVVFLVREDMSAIQRDTWHFIEEDYPNISVCTLTANHKMVCARSIFVAFRHELHGVANTLAREYVHAMANFYFRHYGIPEHPSGGGRRIYLSREGAAIRRVTNEPAIVAMLSRYGFESIEPGSIPFKQQAELFRSADIIVGPHGAALANLIFCRPGTRVLEFFPADYIDDCYLRISKAMELRHDYLFGGKSDFPKRNYAMDSDRLETALKAMIDD